MSDWADKLAGKFIVIDGPDGAGKTTQIKLLCEYLTAEGADVLCAVDPGATAVGERIRQVLLDRDNSRMCPTCEALLFMASRAQLIEEVVRPAISAGKVVVCDRFVSATLAYQGAGGLSEKLIRELAGVAVQGLWPDLTVVLDVPIEVGLGRLSGRPDRIEAKPNEYHQRVRRMFLAQARRHADRFAVVDAAGQVQAVQQQMRRLLRERNWG